MNEKDLTCVCMDDQLRQDFEKMGLACSQIPLLWQMRQIGCTDTECECLFDSRLPAAGRRAILTRKRTSLLQDIRQKETCLDMIRDLETQLFPAEKR